MQRTMCGTSPDGLKQRPRVVEKTSIRETRKRLMSTRPFVTWLELAWLARAGAAARQSAPAVVVCRLAGKSMRFAVLVGERLLCGGNGERTLFDSLEAVSRFMRQLGIPAYRLQLAAIPVAGAEPSACLTLARGRLVYRATGDGR